MLPFSSNDTTLEEQKEPTYSIKSHDSFILDQLGSLAKRFYTGYGNGCTCNYGSQRIRLVPRGTKLKTL